MKKALVTLAVGASYEAMFEKYCRPVWAKYADRHQFDIIVITNPLDTSARSQSRSPAWQKCLILSDATVKNYDQVVWVDSDILINPASPDITDGVPLEKIGAADEYSTPTREDYYSYLQRFYELCDQQNINCLKNLTPTDFHRLYGFEGEFTSVVQTGVMVLSPRYHQELLEYVYYNYEDKGLNLEMRPLSYEILTHDLAHWLSPKFNMLWPYIKQFNYPFLVSPSSFLEKGLLKIGIDFQAKMIRKCVTATFLNNYFLHFASHTTREMKYVNTNISSIFDIK